MNRQKLLWVVTGVAALALILYMLAPKQDLSTPGKIFGAIKHDIEARYSNLHVSGEDDWVAQMDDGLPADVEGYDFKINSQAAPSITISFGDQRGGTTTSNLGDTVPLIDSVMSRAGYKKSQGAANTFYDKADTTCILIMNAQSAVYTISCSTPGLLEQSAAGAKPLVTAYLAAKQDIAEKDVSIGPIVFKDDSSSGQVITASKTAGYRISEAVIVAKAVKYVVLFYQKDGGEWKFGSQATDEYGFRCDDFTAVPDARKAFYDQVCLGPEGYLRLDTTNRALQ